MSILVIAEHDHNNINSSTLNTVSAAVKIGGEIHVLVAGKSCAAAGLDAAKIDGVSKILVADHESYEFFLAENLGLLVADLGKNYSHILAPANSFGKNFLPRVAAMLDVAQISDVMEVLSASVFKRPTYAGNIIATVESVDKIKILTIRTTKFAKAALTGNAVVENIGGKEDCQLARFVKNEGSSAQGPDLTSARIVISGGRGMGSKENFGILTRLADKINSKKSNDCAIGASRAAVDAGYISNDYQVGQTGKIVAPELYVAVGISGAIQHQAGMKDSKIIVAINKDENAPIFEIADYGLVADLFVAIPEIEKLIGK